MNKDFNTPQQLIPLDGRYIPLSLQEYTDILKALYTYRQALVDIQKGVQYPCDVAANALREASND